MKFNTEKLDAPAPAVVIDYTSSIDWTAIRAEINEDKKSILGDIWWNAGATAAQSSSVFLSQPDGIHPVRNLTTTNVTTQSVDCGSIKVDGEEVATKKHVDEKINQMLDVVRAMIAMHSDTIGVATTSTTQRNKPVPAPPPGTYSLLDNISQSSFFE